MNRIATVLCVLLALVYTDSVASAASTEELSKSVVKVVVKAGGNTNHATGLVWKDNSQIVTSLHVMRPNGKVHIEYKGQKITATVSKVLRHADLVLLTTSAPINGATALADYDKTKPAEDTQLKALGFNEDAPKFSSRSLTKGFVDPPETLASFVPSDDRKSLQKAGMPSLDLEIYYTNAGSLLHGYSGAPVFRDGKFVGIGDGGLENGASGVSWIIPALHLDELMSDGQSTLPSDLATVSQHFSAEIDAPAYKEIFAAVSPLYSDSIETRYLTFVKNKTRYLSRLMLPESQEMLFADLQFLLPFTLPTEALQFDIYEEQNYGMVIAVPTGVELVPSGEAQELSASDGGDTALNYWLEEIEGNTVESSLNALADKHLAFINSPKKDGEHDNYVEVDRYIVDYGDGKYALRAAFIDTVSGWVEYVTLAANARTGLVLFVQGYLWEDDYATKKVGELQGLNCRKNRHLPQSNEQCDRLVDMARLIIAAQLTTFSNVLKANRTDY